MFGQVCAGQAAHKQRATYAPAVALMMSKRNGIVLKARTLEGRCAEARRGDSLTISSTHGDARNGRHGTCAGWITGNQTLGQTLTRMHEAFDADKNAAIG
jgi:hypothetical protein